MSNRLLVVWSSSNEDSGVVCQKGECAANDVWCLLNMTKTIQWQHISLPSIASVPEPLVIVTVQTMAVSMDPTNQFSIIGGNEYQLFDIVKQAGRAENGYCLQ